MSSFPKKKNKKVYKKKGNISLRKRKKKIKFIALMTIILAIICAISLINNSRKNKETFSPVEYDNNKVNSIDNIISVEIPSSSDVIDENTTNQIDDRNNTTNTNTNTNSISNSNTSSSNQTTNNSKYYIKVNYGANVVTVYTKDSSGNYTVPVKAMVCSTGTATPKSGIYSIPGRWPWGTLFGNVYGQYCIKITGNILFHSVPYLKRGDPGSLEYWEYDKLGTTASAGCVRLTVSDVLWLYNNCPNGTKVEFYSSSDPGPLGKPSAQKISGNEICRNWDPTDPNPNNPWKNSSINNGSSNNSSSDNTSTDSNTTIDNSNNVTDNNTTENDANENNNINNIDNTTNNNVVSNNTTSDSNNTTLDTNNTTINISNNIIEDET